MTAINQDPDYWYHHRHELEPGMIFETADGRVRLVGRVPGDGTQWIVDDWYNTSWAAYGSTIEPGDLIGAPIKGHPEL
ncbi:hypothetical protein [Comamonas thiooxydans]|uniref:hypothetical protein n=1 Tax=Comamonas thiooxydans TaxID=363952 RepID=UPI000B417976|nr:hypothetical protein [Comamonas thiooxydans]